MKLAKQIEVWPLDRLVPYDRNARTHSPEQVAKIAASMTEFGFNNPILVDAAGGVIIAGHGRLEAAHMLGLEVAPVIVLDHLSDRQRRAYILADNRIAMDAGWDEEMLAAELADLAADGFDVGLAGFSDNEIADLVSGEGGGESGGDGDAGDDYEPEFLADRFGVPPFSIFDTRQGYWQDRKRIWKSFIGDNGESREGTLFKEGGSELNQRIAEIGTVSILDPVLAEVLLKWFCPKNGLTFDTFAGDTVFGAVSAMLERPFVGIELRQEQADLNNARTAGKGYPAAYICDDGQNVLKHLEPESRDFFFSCPPYFDLEVYSDDPRDASNQGDYEGFRKILENAFAGAARVLKPGRFGAVVMSNVRDKRGFYRDICGDIRAIMAANGLQLYNEIVLINAVGSASMRAANYMRNRKVARMHQNVMVFHKGQTGDEIYLSEDFDLLGKLQTIQLHEDVMVFFKGDPGSIQGDFGAVDNFDPLGAAQ